MPSQPKVDTHRLVRCAGDVGLVGRVGHASHISLPDFIAQVGCIGHVKHARIVCCVSQARIVCCVSHVCLVCYVGRVWIVCCFCCWNGHKAFSGISEGMVERRWTPPGLCRWYEAFPGARGGASMSQGGRPDMPVVDRLAL